MGCYDKDCEPPQRPATNAVCLNQIIIHTVAVSLSEYTPKSGASQSSCLFSVVL